MLCKTKIRDTEFYDVDRLVNKTEIRNTIIRAFWEGLKYTDCTYEKKLDIVARDFIITTSLVERIITRHC